MGRRVTATRIAGETSLCTLHAAPFIERFFNEVGGDVMTREIDVPAIKTRLDAGEPLKAIADGLSIPSSTLRSRLRRANGSSPRKSPALREASANGHASADSLDELLLTHFNRLPLLERIRRLLA
jgi:hypothetical protein